MNESRKRWLPLALILVVGILAIVHAERHHIATPASPQAMLDAAADAQHELARVPTHFNPMSDAEEIALGDRLAANYDTELNPHTSTPNQRNQRQEIDTYLQQIGERAAAHARRKLPWHFHFIPDENFVNAFALPGGHVFIGAGLLKLMRSEDALAAVLGHEVEHIDLRHCADRYQSEAHLRNLDPTGLLSLPAAVFMAGYSKQQELEADRDGSTLAVEAGYSPLGLRDLLIDFGRLEHGMGSAPPQRTNPLDEAAHLSLATLSGYFRSHPPAEDRLQQLDALTAANHWPTPKLTPLRLSLPSH
jgi:predicted Zn-dependent protease